MQSFLINGCKITIISLFLQTKHCFSTYSLLTMGRKVYYLYNQLTDTYERVYPSRSSRVWTIVLNVFEVLCVAVVIFTALYYLVDFPRERILREENKKLKNEIHSIDGRLNEALAVMDRIAERDNNFYRVMMQADPISVTRRVAGHDKGRFTAMNDVELVSNVTDKMDLLDRMVYSQIISFDSLRIIASQHKDRIDHIPSVQPISQKDMKQMASGYGYRVDPVYGSTKFHEGMDFASATGTPVYATGNGTVVSAGWQSAYGNLIEIDHGYNYRTRYAHLSEIKVKPGQKVIRGDLIGKVGNTGKSTGSHLHYEVRHNGIPQNPVNYYYQDLTPEQYAEMIKAADAAAHVMD